MRGKSRTNLDITQGDDHNKRLDGSFVSFDEDGKTRRNSINKNPVLGNMFPSFRLGNANTGGDKIENYDEELVQKGFFILIIIKIRHKD